MIFYTYIIDLLSKRQKMENLRIILAKNLRENRQRLGMTQPKLAELADLSTHYVAMIENTRKFPTPEVLERLATAFGIDSHELFSVQPSPENALERLHKEVVTDINQVVNKAVEKAIKEQYSNLNEKNLALKLQKSEKYLHQHIYSKIVVSPAFLLKDSNNMSIVFFSSSTFERIVT